MRTRHILLTLLLIVAVLTPGLLADDPLEKAVSQKATPEILAGDTNAFACDLYARLARQEGNLFFSPESIHAALTMTYLGARGQTAGQMADVLYLAEAPTDKRLPAVYGELLKTLNTPGMVTTYVESTPDPKSRQVKTPVYALNVTNAIWGQKGYPFKKGFVTAVKDSFDAQAAEVDFAKPDTARKEINDWVAEKTKDRIKDLLSPGMITPETVLVLTNAIYFKSKWQEPFEKAATRDEAFHLSADKTVQTPMMHQTKRFSYMETDDFQAVKLPYEMGELSMLAFLPKKFDGLPALEKQLTAENLAEWFKAFKGEEVELTLPKFTFSGEFNLGKTLQAMGMKDAFSNAADFSGMTEAEKLFISAVIHKAFVGVDENGTEAAAATAVVMMRATNGHSHQPVPPKVFRADHPFIFMIYHNRTGLILFMGRMANPAAK